jgi:hypothetical protein
MLERLQEQENETVLPDLGIRMLNANHASAATQVQPFNDVGLGVARLLNFRRIEWWMTADASQFCGSTSWNSVSLPFLYRLL